MGERLESRSTVACEMVRWRSHIGTPSKSGETTAMSISLHSSGEPLTYEPYRMIASTRTALLSSATNSEMILSRSVAVVTIGQAPGSYYSIPPQPLGCIASRPQGSGLGISGRADRPAECAPGAVRPGAARLPGSPDRGVGG